MAWHGRPVITIKVNNNALTVLSISLKMKLRIGANYDGHRGGSGVKADFQRERKTIAILNQPSRTLLRTWRTMALVALVMGGLLWCAAAVTGMKPPWYGALLAWLIILSGPFSLLGFGHWEVLPFLALSVCLYSLSVAWLFWKPSSWSKWVCVGLSVLWLLLGFCITSIGI